MGGATGILISITASPDIGIDEVDLASNMIASEAHEDANVIWGVVFDPTLEDQMDITIIATGFENKAEEEAKNAKAEPVKAPVKKPVIEDDDDEDDSEDEDPDFAELMGMLKKDREEPAPAYGNGANNTNNGVNGGYTGGGLYGGMPDYGRRY